MADLADPYRRNSNGAAAVRLGTAETSPNLPLSLFSVARGRANGLAYAKTRQRLA